MQHFFYDLCVKVFKTPCNVRTSCSVKPALTKILFTGQQICADILDTPFCGNKTIITGILLAIEQYKDEVAENINSELVRKCIKYFRRYAAVTSVDFLSEAEIQYIIFKYLSEN